MGKIALGFAAVAAFLLTVAMLFTAGWTAPPIHGAQAGYRGLELIQLSTPESERLLKLANVLPDAIDKASPDGDRATAVYQNVQVLTDLSSDQLLRVMLGFASWVAPADIGCPYCHNPDNLADDGKYTKRVARRMLQMVRHINKDWQAHVAATGVTCYTCHRGQPVPSKIWFAGEPPKAVGFAATNYGMGHPNQVNGSTAMATDPFSGLLADKAVIRVQATQALPTGLGASIQSTENTYSLMMAISSSLGVNCTFCHNSREFRQWDGAPPQRVTAWQGLQMVRDLNGNYLTPLKAEFPVNRLGPTGDGPKLYCATCHQGASKPLLGVSLAKDWPELGGVAKP
jgi:photosynthetic reaction center cytochrome c subunit